jgi:hypothetical protein
MRLTLSFKMKAYPALYLKNEASCAHSKFETGSEKFPPQPHETMNISKSKCRKKMVSEDERCLRVSGKPPESLSS